VSLTKGCDVESTDYILQHKIRESVQVTGDTESTQGKKSMFLEILKTVISSLKTLIE
jgi:hypothetical protein